MAGEAEVRPKAREAGPAAELGGGGGGGWSGDSGRSGARRGSWSSAWEAERGGGIDRVEEYRGSDWILRHKQKWASEKIVFVGSALGIGSFGSTIGLSSI